MSKRIYIISIAVILLLAVCVVLWHNFMADRNREITPEEAVALCYLVMGEKDESTGFPFSFGVTEKFETNGEDYYAIRASWLVNNSHMSYIGDFFVRTDGREMYDGFVSGNEYTFGKLIWSE